MILKTPDISLESPATTIPPPALASLLCVERTSPQAMLLAKARERTSRTIDVAPASTAPRNVSSNAGYVLASMNPSRRSVGTAAPESPCTTETSSPVRLTASTLSRRLHVPRGAEAPAEPQRVAAGDAPVVGFVGDEADQ